MMAASRTNASSPSMETDENSSNILSSGAHESTDGSLQMPRTFARSTAQHVQTDSDSVVGSHAVTCSEGPVSVPATLNMLFPTLPVQVTGVQTSTTTASVTSTTNSTITTIAAGASPATLFAWVLAQRGPIQNEAQRTERQKFIRRRRLMASLGILDGSPPQPHPDLCDCLLCDPEVQARWQARDKDLTLLERLLRARSENPDEIYSRSAPESYESSDHPAQAKTTFGAQQVQSPLSHGCGVTQPSVLPVSGRVCHQNDSPLFDEDLEIYKSFCSRHSDTTSSSSSNSDSDSTRPDSDNYADVIEAMGAVGEKVSLDELAASGVSLKSWPSPTPCACVYCKPVDPKDCDFGDMQALPPSPFRGHCCSTVHCACSKCKARFPQTAWLQHDECHAEARQSEGKRLNPADKDQPDGKRRGHGVSPGTRQRWTRMAVNDHASTDSSSADDSREAKPKTINVSAHIVSQVRKLRQKRALLAEQQNRDSKSQSHSSGSSPGTSTSGTSPRFDAQLFVQGVKKRLKSLASVETQASPQSRSVQQEASAPVVHQSDPLHRIPPSTHSSGGQYVLKRGKDGQGIQHASVSVLPRPQSEQSMQNSSAPVLPPSQNTQGMVHAASGQPLHKELGAENLQSTEQKREEARMSSPECLHDNCYKCLGPQVFQHMGQKLFGAKPLSGSQAQRQGTERQRMAGQQTDQQAANTHHPAACQTFQSFPTKSDETSGNVVKALSRPLEESRVSGLDFAHGPNSSFPNSSLSLAFAALPLQSSQKKHKNEGPNSQCDAAKMPKISEAEKMDGGWSGSNTHSIPQGAAYNPLVLTPPSTQLRGGLCQHKRVNCGASRSQPAEGESRGQLPDSVQDQEACRDQPAGAHDTGANRLVSPSRLLPRSWYNESAVSRDRLTDLYRELFEDEEDSDEELKFLATVCDVRLSESEESGKEGSMDSADVNSGDCELETDEDRTTFETSSSQQPPPLSLPSLVPADQQEVPLLPQASPEAASEMKSGPAQCPPSHSQPSSSSSAISADDEDSSNSSGSSSGDDDGLSSDENYEGDEEYECDCSTCQDQAAAVKSAAAAAAADGTVANGQQGVPDCLRRRWPSLRDYLQQRPIIEESLDPPGAVGGVDLPPVPPVQPFLNRAVGSSMYGERHPRDNVPRMLWSDYDPEHASYPPYLQEMMERLRHGEGGYFDYPSQSYMNWVQTTLQDVGASLQVHSRNIRTAEAKLHKLLSHPADKSETDDLCPICLVNFQEGEMLFVLPDCKHLFHGHCIRKWLTMAPSCPVCRRDVS